MICDLGAHPLAKDAVHLCTSSVSSTRGTLLPSSQKETCLLDVYFAVLVRGAFPRETLTDSLGCTVWRMPLHAKLVHLVTVHRLQKSCSVDTPLCMAICNHVSCVTPLD